jgi:tetratricopeptide (TPR) repeat protein
LPRAHFGPADSGHGAADIGPAQSKVDAPMSRPGEQVALEQLQREVMRLVQARDWPNALTHIDRVLKVRPDMPRMLLNQAQCLLAMGRRLEARKSADAALSLAERDAVLLDALGSFYSFAGHQRDALKAFERAVALAPDNAHFMFNRATVQRFLGNLSAAEADYDQVIALRPLDFEAYKNRSDLRTQTAERNHVAELEGLVTRGFADWRAEMQIRYSLAKEYEDLGEYAKSFTHLREGAAKRRANLHYDVTVDVATVDWIMEAFPGGPAQLPPAADGSVQRNPPFSAKAVPQPAVAKQPVPIFIVGLPRSGTTLVDRILSSHSNVKSAGELNDFALAMVAAVRRDNTAQLPRRELVARSAHIDFAALGREYLARAAAAVGSCDYFTDKMPLNYLYCGLIRRALPNAKIIHLTRHPMASGYAMYKTLFKDGYPFSYDLREIAQYYAAYRRLMDHWTATLPGVIHTLSYEGLVADQLTESHKLLEFCGLEWEEACADFHRNAAATTTASASQVRQPIYDTSVAQWRHYVSQLAPLREALTSAGINL